ncbi:MAG TPA: choice-of-anchor X domain-containing protein [Ignavibacteria bacterium]|nr:choice-of-anchor X domain-containing protein [Ignavibacteria bacterium]
MHKIKYFLIPVILGIFMYSCEKEDTSVIDPILHFPSITSNYYTPQLFNSDTIGIIAGATVESEDPVEKVEVKFFDLGNNVLASINLQDNGVYPDTTAGDGKYTGVLNYVFACRQVGIHKIEFLATNVSGLTSSPIQSDVQVIRSPNQPPVASGIVISPDSIQVNVESFFTFMITATDPNGPCDIAKVFYTGFRPSGVPLTTSLELFDDGSCCQIGTTGVTSGDTTANDSKFTRQTYGAPNETGYYKYYLRAVDRSGDTSNILSDSIYVY